MRELEAHTVRHDTGDQFIRLYHGNLAAIPPAEAVDLLVVSAYSNDYTPTRTSLIGALSAGGVSVLDLSRDKAVDLGEAFACWLSRDVSTRYASRGFRRILCFEPPRSAPDSEAVAGLFRAIAPFAFGDSPIRSVAMPVLTAGDRNENTERMLRLLLTTAKRWMERGLPLQTLKIVIYHSGDEKMARRVFREVCAAGSSQDEGSQAVRTASSEYDLFLSYSRADSAEVYALAAAIGAAWPRVRLFIDRLELEAGAPWQGTLDRAIEACRYVVPVYSPDYLKSAMCIEEFNMARVRHRTQAVLKPIYLRAEPSPHMTPKISRKNSCSWSTST